MSGSVIVAGARTPIGKLSGALGSFSATDLGGFAIAAALERAGVAPDQVDYVFMGQVILAGAGQITARQAATKGGIPMDVLKPDKSAHVNGTVDVVFQGGGSWNRTAGTCAPACHGGATMSWR